MKKEQAKSYAWTFTFLGLGSLIPAFYLQVLLIYMVSLTSLIIANQYWIESQRGS